MITILVIYCAIIAVCSALGGSIPSYVNLTHRKIQLTLSLVSGVMLGVALLHLLPHSIYVLKGNVELALIVCLCGLLFMFFMIRTFHFHQHDLAVDSDHAHVKKELCDHQHDRHHVHCASHDGRVDLSWAGVCFGLAIHTLLDGIALAATVQSNGNSVTLLGMNVAGLSVFLAIVLHKPLDALSITSLMAARGWAPDRQLAVNVVFSLMCPLGAILFFLTVNQFESREWILGFALAFSAGMFLCISLGDLLPEVHFHSHDRVSLSAMLVLGIAIAFAIEQLPGHQHELQLKPPSPASLIVDSPPAGTLPTD